MGSSGAHITPHHAQSPTVCSHACSHVAAPSRSQTNSGPPGVAPPDGPGIPLSEKRDPLSKTTTLGEAQLTQSPEDIVAVELIQPDDMPPIVRIGWPLKPTIVDPQRFPDTAVMLTRLFATAAIELASKKAKLGGRCDR
jgi:hypothetical protein